ncbi:glycosyltransferase [Xenorhabdus bharatensis]|uniref:glycosyltransferase n=1 Tax=Xenorhabdus bharatensis TaxID=3136256 RepID=UPI0030F3FD92
MHLKVSILLSVYNGESHLEEQLLSLLQQKNIDNYEVDVILRDDGSSDNSANIINQYCNQYPNFFKKNETVLNNLGASDSFLYLLKEVDADIYLFCDQDDIWHENKISISVQSLISHKDFGKKPILFFSNLSLVNDTGKYLNISLWELQKIKPSLFNLWSNFLCNSMVTGCTMAFTKEVKKIETLYSRPAFFLHDQWISVLISKNGCITYSNVELIKYRQHSYNVIGAENFDFKKIINKSVCFLKKIRAHYSLCKNLSDVSFSRYFFRKLIISFIRLF